MKTLRYFLYVAVMAMAFVGCRKPVEVAFVETAQEIAAQGATVEIALESNGGWTIAPTPDWIAVSPMSGNGNARLTLTVQPNNGTEARSAEIKATTKDHSATCVVTQDFVVSPFLSVTPNEIQCDRLGGEYEVSVQSNVEWRFSELPDWIAMSATSGENNSLIHVTVDPISGEVSEDREAVMIVKGEAVQASLYVKQSLGTIYAFSVSPRQIEFDYDGGTATLAVASNINWSASTEADWVSFTPESGNSNAEVTVNVAENSAYESREAFIRFDYTYPDSSTGFTNVMVVQGAAPNPHFLTVTPLQLDFDAEGGSAEITVQCDTYWNLELQPDYWVTSSAMEGTGNGMFVLTVEANQSVMDRDLEVPVFSGELKQVIVIHQGSNVGPEFSFSADTVFISPEGAIETLYITSNVGWQLTAPSWVTLYPTTGNGNGYTGVIVERNPTSEARVGVITAMFMGQVIGQAVVYQEARIPYLELNVTEITVPAEGGTYVVEVSSNQSWTVSKGAAWLQYSPTSGLGNGSIEITVDAMLSARPRTAEIYVTGDEDGLVIITVNQQP